MSSESSDEEENQSITIKRIKDNLMEEFREFLMHPKTYILGDQKQLLDQILNDLSLEERPKIQEEGRNLISGLQILENMLYKLRDDFYKKLVTNVKPKLEKDELAKLEPTEFVDLVDSSDEDVSCDPIGWRMPRRLYAAEPKRFFHPRTYDQNRHNPQQHHPSTSSGITRNQINNFQPGIPVGALGMQNGMIGTSIYRIHPYMIDQSVFFNGGIGQPFAGFHQQAQQQPLFFQYPPPPCSNPVEERSSLRHEERMYGNPTRETANQNQRLQQSIDTSRGASTNGGSHNQRGARSNSHNQSRYEQLQNNIYPRDNRVSHPKRPMGSQRAPGNNNLPRVTRFSPMSSSTRIENQVPSRSEMSQNRENNNTKRAIPSQENTRNVQAHRRFEPSRLDPRLNKKAALSNNTENNRIARPTPHDHIAKTAKPNSVHQPAQQTSRKRQRPDSVIPHALNERQEENISEDVQEEIQNILLEQSEIAQSPTTPVEPASKKTAVESVATSKENVPSVAEIAPSTSTTLPCSSTKQSAESHTIISPDKIKKEHDENVSDPSFQSYYCEAELNIKMENSDDETISNPNSDDDTESNESSRERLNDLSDATELDRIAVKKEGNLEEEDRQDVADTNRGVLRFRPLSDLMGPSQATVTPDSPNLSPQESCYNHQPQSPEDFCPTSPQDNDENCQTPPEDDDEEEIVPFYPTTQHLPPDFNNVILELSSQTESELSEQGESAI